jgi:hypothetical protein
MDKLFDGKTNRLCLDQHGRPVWARTVKELRQQVGGKVSKMYTDKPLGGTFWTGYVVGGRWFSVYKPCEIKQS